MAKAMYYGPVNKQAFEDLNEYEQSLLPSSPAVYPKTVQFNAAWWIKNEQKVRDSYNKFLLIK